MFNTIKACEAVCGTLSVPSKMPCYSYSIPAKRCITGSKLAKKKGTICSVCYARKNRYGFPNVQNALERRFQSLRHPDWTDAISELIYKKEKSGFFRWHDSGDIQGVWHLENIVEVAMRLPSIQFWLPTREFDIVQAYQKKNWPLSWGGAMIKPNAIPRNLTIRLSSLMLDGAEPDLEEYDWHVKELPTSSAHPTNFDCPASSQKGQCLDCRLCWNKHSHVIYKQH